MKDDTPIRVRRYAIYTLVIFLVAVFLVFLTEFFWACAYAKYYFQVP